MDQAARHQATPERWRAALGRAVEANLIYLELIGGDGAFAVSSSRDPEAGYIATTGSCTCPSGRSGAVICLHRALVRCLVGELPVEPEPEPQVCPNCLGSGASSYWNGEGGLSSFSYEPCPVCRPAA